MATLLELMAKAAKAQASKASALKAQAKAQAPKAQAPKAQAKKQAPRAQALRAQAPRAQAPRPQAPRAQASSKRVASRRAIIAYLMDNAPEAHRDPEPLMPGERELSGAENAESRRIHRARRALLEEARELGEEYMEIASEAMGLEIDRLLRRFDEYGARRDPILADYLDAHDYLAENRAYKAKIASGWVDPVEAKTVSDPDVQVDDRGPRATAVRMAFPADLERGGPQLYLSLRIHRPYQGGWDPKKWRYQPYEVYVPSSEFQYDQEGLRYSVASVQPDRMQDENSYNSWSTLDGVSHNFERLKDAVAFAQKVGPGTEVIAYDTEMLRNTVFAEAVWDMIRPTQVKVHTVPPIRGKYHGGRNETWIWNGTDWGVHHKQSLDLTYAQYVNFKVPSDTVAFPIGTTHAPGSVHRDLGRNGGIVLDRDAFYLGISALRQASFTGYRWIWPVIPREDMRIYVTPGGPVPEKKASKQSYASGIDPKVRARYMKVRAHAQRGVENERDNARIIMEKMEAEFPGLR